MIDFSKSLTDLDDKAFEDRLSDGKLTPLTLGRAAANALTSAIPGEMPAAGAEHVTRFALAMKVKDAKKLDISTDEIESIKQRIAKFYTNSTVVGRAWLLLDPASRK